MKAGTTDIPFREWPWHARLIEKTYRLFHGGQIRTLVLSRTQWTVSRKDHPDDLQHVCHGCGYMIFRVFITAPGPVLYLECVRCGQHLHADSE